MNVSKTSSLNIDNWIVKDKKIYNLKKLFFQLFLLNLKLIIKNGINH